MNKPILHPTLIPTVEKVGLNLLKVKPKIFFLKCDVEDLEQMKIDDGIQVFFNSPEKEKEQLIQTIKNGGYVVVAYTEDKTIVGFLVLEEFKIPTRRTFYVYSYIWDSAIEVSKKWRKKGIASKLLRFAFKDSFFDDKIVLARGLTEYWDCKPHEKEAYRNMLINLAQKVGFKLLPYSPFEDDFLMVRIGPKVDKAITENLHKIFEEQRKLIMMDYDLPLP